MKKLPKNKAQFPLLVLRIGSKRQKASRIAIYLTGQSQKTLLPSFTPRERQATPKVWCSLTPTLFRTLSIPVKPLPMCFVQSFTFFRFCRSLTRLNAQQATTYRLDLRSRWHLRARLLYLVKTSKSFALICSFLFPAFTSESIRRLWIPSVRRLS